MKKREFLSLLLTLLGLTAAGSFVYPLVRFLAPPSGKAKSKQITFKKSEIPVGEAKEIPFGGVPAIIINRPGKGFIAFSRVCSHLGCLIDYNKTQNRYNLSLPRGHIRSRRKCRIRPSPKTFAEVSLESRGRIHPDWVKRCG